MIRSMTSYGRCQMQLGGKDITVELKSVNHRFFEFSVRAPRGYAFLEDKLKSLVQSQVSRGKIDMFLTVVSAADQSVEVEINMPAAKGYVDALKALSKQFKLKNDVTVSTLVNYQDIFTLKRQEENEDEVWQCVETVARSALDSFVAMRAAEGERLYEDINSRLDAIIGMVEKVEKLSPETVRAYNDRLLQRMKELLGDAQVDQQRLLTECAIFADKVAVDEETVRLRSHVTQFRSELEKGDKSVGKKLDFLVQEMNREANTIGSKCQNTDIAYTVVEIKAEIEKIREQIQNIE